MSKRWVDPVPLCNGREERVKSVFRGFLKQDRAVLLRVLETLVGVQHQTARVPVVCASSYSVIMTQHFYFIQDLDSLVFSLGGHSLGARW